MSETIEERAKRICKRLDYIDAWNAGGEEAIELIEDLMAERSTGIPVDLDTLFPKEVMGKATLFGIEGEWLKPGLRSLIYNVHAIDGDGEYDIVAYKENRSKLKELARVCVRLRLTVQKVED
jgi:hypothetical protein